jgi:hypothetical protein
VSRIVAHRVVWQVLTVRGIIAFSFMVKASNLKKKSFFPETFVLADPTTRYHNPEEGIVSPPHR